MPRGNPGWEVSRGSSDAGTALWVSVTLEHGGRSLGCRPAPGGACPGLDSGVRQRALKRCCGRTRWPLCWGSITPGFVGMSLSWASQARQTSREEDHLQILHSSRGAARKARACVWSGLCRHAPVQKVPLLKGAPGQRDLQWSGGQGARTNQKDCGPPGGSVWRASNSWFPLRS